MIKDLKNYKKKKNELINNNKLYYKKKYTKINKNFKN